MEMRVEHVGHMGDTTGFGILGGKGLLYCEYMGFDRGSFTLQHLG